MLQVFYLDIAKLDLDVACICNEFQVFSCVFAGVSDVCCKCFNCFERMLQVFHLVVAKVDLVLHVLQWDHVPQPPATAAGALESVHSTNGPHLQARGKRTRHECRVVSTCF
jgi:hypothetical protein